MKAKLTATLALITLFHFSNVQAAPIDNELAILASEQAEEQQPQNTEKISKPVPKSQKELEAEQKRLREEQRAEEKKLKKEREDARKQIEEGRKEQITNNDVRKTPRPRATSVRQESDVVKNSAADSATKPSIESPIDSGEKKNETLTTPAEKISPTTDKPSVTNQPSETVQQIQPVKPIPKVEPEVKPEVKPSTSTDFKTIERPLESPVGIANPVTRHANFDEVVEAVGFTPLYLPKKSGYTVTEILSIDRKIADIRYGRRWEPEVSLSVRTYKRAADEELQDISGIHGAKWRVDTTGGINVYLAKLSDDTHAAAWAVGDYTFSAYVQSLSFAAFHALVIEELVDLSNHYYIG